MNDVFREVVTKLVGARAHAGKNGVSPTTYLNLLAAHLMDTLTTAPDPRQLLREFCAGCSAIVDEPEWVACWRQKQAIIQGAVKSE